MYREDGDKMTIVYVFNIVFMLGCLIMASFFYGRSYERKKTPKEEIKPRARAEPDAEVIKKLTRLNKEYANFLNYDGTEQEDIHV